jgi:predicted RNA-binding Zn-ribbon protein involved in translation (DUF1610 family)
MNVDGHSVKCPNCYREFLRQDIAYEVGTMEAPLRADEGTSKTLTLAGEPFPCPDCPAMIKTDRRFRGLAMWRGIAIVFFAIPFAPFFVGGIFLPLGDPPQLDWVVKGIFLTPTGLGVTIGVLASRIMRHVNRWEVASMRRTCQHCGAVVSPDGAEFCSTCGTKLPIAVIRITTSEDQIEIRNPISKSRTVAPVGTCLVCDLEMNPFEDLASCPRCGNIFHRAHLLKWVHMKQRCPVCNERLVGSEIITTFNDESTCVHHEEGM